MAAGVIGMRRRQQYQQPLKLDSNDTDEIHSKEVPWYKYTVENEGGFDARRVGEAERLRDGQHRWSTVKEVEDEKGKENGDRISNGCVGQG